MTPACKIGKLTKADDDRSLPKGVIVISQKPKILVVGSFVMDMIATTDVFPNQGQTVLGKTFKKAPGGKGANQAVQAARLGAEVTMFGKVGKDANATEMLETCAAAGVNVSRVAVDEELPSACSMIILEEAPGQQTKNRILVLSGSNMNIQPADIAFLEEEIADYDLVMLQLEIPMAINEQIAAYARAKGVPVMLNSAPSAPLSAQLLANLSFISPNEHEAADLTGITIRKDGADAEDYGFVMADAQAATKALRDKGVENVLITLGSAGAVLDTAEGFFFSPALHDIKAVDPTAAGDSFVSSFCVGYCCGWSWDDILLFANHAATITVSSIGAMPALPKLPELAAFITQRTGKKFDISRLS